MHSGNFAMFGNDPEVTALARLDADSLLVGLADCIDTRLLDQPIDTYQVANLRYLPKQKLVLGLTAPGSLRCIAVRIYPPGNLAERVAQAQRRHPGLVFALPSLDGVAWVYPAERKLDFSLLADEAGLRKLLLSQRGYCLTDASLARFVPEHAYTLCLKGQTESGCAVVDYAKVHDDRSGARSQTLLTYIAAQLQHSRIKVPARVQYLAAERLLLQQGLPRLPNVAVADYQVADALAVLHHVRPLADMTTLPGDDLCVAKVRALLEVMFPHWANRVESLWSAVRTAMPAQQSAPVFLHGDVHLGNIFALPDGELGIIDFDAARLGPAADDLSSFFGFKLWLAMRNGEPIKRTLSEFPAFIEQYNCCASAAVGQRTAWLLLAEKMFSERIRRGLARGKLSDEGELLAFMDVAEHCLNAADGITPR